LAREGSSSGKASVPGNTAWAGRPHQEATDGHDAKAVLLVHSMQDGRLPKQDGQLALREAFLTYGWKVYEVRSAADAIAFLQERPLPVALVERVEDWKALVNATELMPHPPCLIVTSRLADSKVWRGVLEVAAAMFSLVPSEARE
jgi:hypothetical protein